MRMGWSTSANRNRFLSIEFSGADSDGAGLKVLVVLHGIGDGSGGIPSSCWEVQPTEGIEGSIDGWSSEASA